MEVCEFYYLCPCPEVSLNLLDVELLEGIDNRQLEIVVLTEGYEGEEVIVMYVEPVIRSLDTIGKSLTNSCHLF